MGILSEGAMEIFLMQKMQSYMLSGMFSLGGLTFMFGVIILIWGVWSKDMRETLAQTNRLAQKGLTDEISGLVGNASMLLTTISDLIRTRNGTGVILIVTGALLMVIPYCLAFLTGK